MGEALGVSTRVQIKVDLASLAFAAEIRAMLLAPARWEMLSRHSCEAMIRR